MIGVLSMVAGFIAGVALGAFLDRKFPCGCGRAVPWHFHSEHERWFVMLFWAAYCTGVLVWGLVTISWFWSILYALLATWSWRRVWFHEKGRIKKAARSLGRVVVTEHGTLKVRPES